MGEIRPARIKPRQPHFGQDTGQGRRVYGDGAHVAPRDLIGHRDRQERRRPVHFAHGAFKLFVVQRDQFGQTVDHLRHVARILAHDDDAVARAVLGNRVAVAVEYLAPFGRDQADVDPVFFGEKAELVGLIDLKIAHTKGQCADKHGLQPADKHGAAAERGVGFFQLARVASHGRPPTRSSEPGLGRRMPKNTCEASTTRG